jgi:3-oxoacyl-(acyl-carrier-protein) synthase
MDNIFVTAASMVTDADVSAARLGQRFGRLDLASQLALLAVESLGLDFDTLPRERIGICLAARVGSLSTDVEYWNGRDAVGGPSPTLFAYTLPSAAIGEIAIRYQLTGPNLCFVGRGDAVLAEAGDWIRRGEAEACLCVSCDVVSAAAAEIIQTPAAARACALLLKRGSDGRHVLRENDRDMESLCAVICARKSAS